MQDTLLWYGFLAPAKTSAADAERLADFARTIRRNHDQWGAIIRANGFTLQE